MYDIKAEYRLFWINNVLIKKIEPTFKWKLGEDTFNKPNAKFSNLGISLHCWNDMDNFN